MKKTNTSRFLPSLFAAVLFSVAPHVQAFSLFNGWLSKEPSAQEDVDHEVAREFDKQLDSVARELGNEIEEDIALTRAERRRMREVERRRVARKVKDEMRFMQRDASHDRLRRRVHTRGVGPRKRDFIYKIPNWPHEATFYAERDLLDITLKADHATKAYSSSGRRQNVSKLVFSEDPIELKDILLASKLIAEQKVTAQSATPNPTTSHFLSILSNQALTFDARVESYVASVGYARHFLGDSVTFGIHVPIVQRRNKLSLVSDISSADRDTLGGATPKFFDRFGTLEQFLREILTLRSIDFSKRDTEVGIGDVRLFCNLEIHTHEIERLVTGLKVVFPTAHERITDRLWYPELGNGGFVEFSWFASALWSLKSYFNPHLFASVGGSIPSRVNRRVPKKKEYDGVTPTAGNDASTVLTIFAGEVQFSSAFSEFDTLHRRFATQTKNVKIRPGPVFCGRVGNVFEHMFSRKGFLDIFYDLKAKGADYISGNELSSDFNGAVLTRNTFEIAHTLGASFLYQLSGTKRLRGGVSYTIAGRNTMRLLSGEASFDIEF